MFWDEPYLSNTSIEKTLNISSQPSNKSTASKQTGLNRYSLECPLKTLYFSKPGYVESTLKRFGISEGNSPTYGF